MLLLLKAPFAMGTPLAFFLLCFYTSLSGIFCAEPKSLHRTDFPESFVFGVSTSAYQYEGAAFEDGKGVGIWDTFAHQGRVLDGSNGDVTSDGYHRYKEDVKLLSETGFDALRFSISWTRLLPDGRGKINPKGLQFYNNLINELLDHGVQPYVTLNHFDLPQKLDEEYGGWIDSRIVDDFVSFAEICFREFGDRVKHWMTINEANTFGQLGYSEGVLAPGRCSLPYMNCAVGNSTTEPYLATHNMLLAHSAAVKLYRNKFQETQKGLIGLTALAYFYWPLTNKTVDIIASQRALDFHIGWIVEPLLYGHYPKIMQKIVGSRLPSFTASQKRDLLNSFDFIGLSHYSTLYAYDTQAKKNPPSDYLDDMSVTTKDVDETGIPVNGNCGFGSVPLGFENLLEYMKQRYGNPPIVITESGYADTENSTEKSLNDTKRVSFFHDYTKHMLKAMRNGSNVRGYFAWTLVDGFEYALGYKASFGLHHVNLFTDLRREPKQSAKWFQKFLLPKQILNLPKSTSSRPYFT